MIDENATLDKYNIRVSLLKPHSDKRCVVFCDYCGAFFDRKYGKIIRGRKNISKDACSSQLCQTKKRQEVFMLRYGTIHPTQNLQVKEKRKQTFIERFGCDNPAKTKEVQEKIKQTNVTKFGFENASQSPNIVAKRRQTNFERYGYTDARKNKNVQQKIENTMVEKHGVEHYGYKQRLDFEGILKACKDYIPQFEYSEYLNKSTPMPYLCIIHNKTFNTTITALHNNTHQCPECQVTSFIEQELQDFVQQYCPNALLNSRKIISPFELDVYIPEHKLGLEMHGLYWHSEAFKKRTYHKEKYLAAQKEGIYLFQIYEDEWRDKKEIVQSIIRQKLGVSEHKLPARKLKIVENLPVQQIQQFLEENHLQGKCNANKISYSVSLVDPIVNNILFTIVVGSLFSAHEKGKLQIFRAASLKNHTIVGGFSRCMKYIVEFAKLQNVSSIVTYSDAMYSSGAVYEKYGFIKGVHSEPSYYYTNNVNRFTKYKYRAANGKSERQIVEELGYNKIHNAGTVRWELDIQVPADIITEETEEVLI